MAKPGEEAVRSRGAPAAGKSSSDRPHPARETAGHAPGRSGGEPSWPAARRLAWFVLYWLAGIAVIGTVAYVIRTVLIG